MSRHHIETGHANVVAKIRRHWQAQLPLPCTECGRPVMPEDAWHVAHITAASMGGRTTVDNTGPAHSTCNLRAGGLLGAAITSKGRRRAQDIRAW